MTRGLDRRTAIVFAGIAGVVALFAAILEYTRTENAGEAGEAFVAALIALAVAGLALSLPGITLRGGVIGGLFVVAGILTWTSTNRPIVIWAVLAAEVVVFAVWSWPWLANARRLPALGGAWLGLSYWVFGVLGALFVSRAGHLGVAAQRLAYLGVFTLAVLAVVAVTASDRPRARDLSIGVAAAILLGIAALLLVGAGSLFDTVHAIPDSASARVMTNRFWGGPGLYYHPNSLAGFVVIAAIRIGFDRAFAAWQRFGVAAVTALVLSISDSRTGFVFAAAAAGAHGLLVLRRRRADLDAWGRAAWVALATPFLVLVIVFTIGGGSVFLFRDRFTEGGADVTSGRTDTWRQVWVDWQHAGWAEKTFGDARTSRAVVERLNDGNPPEGPRRKLNTDNAAVGAFRRGGVLGAIGFAVGVALLLWHALRRRPDGSLPAAWFTIGALAIVPTIATEDWLIGGTNGAIWLLLLAGEVRTTTRGAPPVEVAQPEPAQGLSA